MRAFELKIDNQSLITPKLFDQHRQPLSHTDTSTDLTQNIGQLALVLELARQRFENGEAASSIVERLAADLHKMRVTVGSQIWQKLLPVAQNHPVSAFLQQDPFTRWSFEKPRGYSGDASLLDIIYKHPDADAIVDASTELGKAIFAYTVEAETSVAARERRQILADFVDNTAARTDNAEVMAIACGHLREAELSSALRDGKLARWVALDQDADSVEAVREANYSAAVKPVIGNVAGLMRRSYDLGSFDLVYASGLYDYLPRAVAVRLTQRIMDVVKAGGEYLFANYSDEITTDGYMETFMDWPLLLRSANDMWDIINASVDRNKVDVAVFYGENRNIVYGKIRKRAN
jgi:hypothetical protein